MNSNKIGGRLRDARKNYPKNFREDYVVLNDDGLPKTIFCKITGATLQSTRKIGSKIMLAPTDAYMEIRIKFKDKNTSTGYSYHATPVSKDAVKLLDIKALESIYCADLLQWEKEEAIISDRWCFRKPVGFEVLD